MLKVYISFTEKLKRIVDDRAEMTNRSDGAQLVIIQKKKWEPFCTEFFAVVIDVSNKCFTILFYLRNSTLIINKCERTLNDADLCSVVNTR